DEDAQVRGRGPLVDVVEDDLSCDVAAGPLDDREVEAVGLLGPRRIPPAELLVGDEGLAGLRGRRDAAGEDPDLWVVENLGDRVGVVAYEGSQDHQVSLDRGLGGQVDRALGHGPFWPGVPVCGGSGDRVETCNPRRGTPRRAKRTLPARASAHGRRTLMERGGAMRGSPHATPSPSRT